MAVIQLFGTAFEARPRVLDVGHQRAHLTGLGCLALLDGDLFRPIGAIGVLQVERELGDTAHVARGDGEFDGAVARTLRRGGCNPVAALQDFERPGAVTLYGECGGAFRGTVGIERKHIGGDFEIRHPLVVVIVHT